VLDDQHDQFPHNQENQQTVQNNIDVYQKKKNDLAAERILRRDIGQLDFEKNQCRDHQSRDENDDSLTAAALGLLDFEAFLDEFCRIRCFHSDSGP